jgi:hypothetical protein
MPHEQINIPMTHKVVKRASNREMHVGTIQSCQNWLEKQPHHQREEYDILPYWNSSLEPQF